MIYHARKENRGINSNIDQDPQELRMTKQKRRQTPGPTEYYSQL